MLAKVLFRSLLTICCLGSLFGIYHAPAYADDPVPSHYVFLPAITSSGCQYPNLLQNGSFEAQTHWTQLAGSYPIIQAHSIALNGTRVAWFGGYNNAVDKLAQTFTVPSGCKTVKIVLHLNLTTSEILDYPYDKFYASLQPVNGITNPEVLVADNTTECGCTWVRMTYIYHQIPNPGQPLRLYFHATTDSSRVTNFRIDLVSIEARSQPFTPTGTTIQTADGGLISWEVEPVTEPLGLAEGPQTKEQ